MYKIPAKTLFIGQQLVFVPECHSTNDEVQQLIQGNGASDGVVVITDHQTKGRGQRNTVWESEAGKNITFSIGLRPNFLKAGDQFFLSMAVSLAIFDYLAATLYHGDVLIKWPNDILVNGKKICGILIENTIASHHIQHSVVGIGLNVNQVSFNFPQVTSMALIEKKEFNLAELLEHLVSSIEKRYLQLRAGETASIQSSYQEALLGYGQEQVFSIKGKKFIGVITGLSPSGKLEVTEGDIAHVFDFKEIEFVY